MGNHKGESRSSGRRAFRFRPEPLRESGIKFFDNSKIGKFTPITPGRLRSAWRSDGVDYYKFCSSMLSSTVDLQGELSQALFDCGVDSPGRASAPRKNGTAMDEADESVESCGIATAASFELRKRFGAPWQTTY